MALTSWTLACILLATGPAQNSDLVPINKRNFKIPILIEPSKRAQIKLLKLYVSNDEGKSWAEASVRTPDQDHFAYYAPADGVYWFTVAVVDQKDRQTPPDPYKVPPNQKILVDTLPPEIKITSAERVGEELRISWEIQEDHPDIESIRLEYRPVDAPVTALWYAMPINHAMKDSAKVRLADPSAVVLRLEMKDQTGNLGTATRELPAMAQPERITAAPPPAPLPPGGIPPGSPLAGVGGATFPPPPPDQLPMRLPPSMQPPVQPNMQPNVVDARPLDQPHPACLPQPAPLPAARFDAWPPMERQPIPPPVAAGQGNDKMQQVIAWSPGIDPGPAASTPRAFPPHGPMPNVKVVNDPEVSLEYETKAGPSGVKKVELYVTEDDGKTWSPFAEDSARKSPITFRLPHEGVFGFRLVVTSGADLSEGPPASGTPPEIRLELDMTPPVVQLYEPKGDALRPDTLVLSWSVTDRNLADKPVTLEYAESEGNWQVIAVGQPATGSHSWQLPKPMAYVLLRATAVDAAGNRSVAQTTTPILVDLSKPKGWILGISAPAHKQPASELPLAPGPR